LGVTRSVQSLDFNITDVESLAVCGYFGDFAAVSSTNDGEGVGFQLSLVSPAVFPTVLWMERPQLTISTLPPAWSWWLRCVSNCYWEQPVLLTDEC
jgi:hypothetical protein